MVESTPVPDPGELVGRRVGAGLLDLLALVPLFIVLALTIGDTGTTDGEFRVALEGGAFLVFVGLSLLYYFVFEALFGQTLGKRALSLRISTDDSGSPGVGAVLTRTLMRLIDFLPVFYLLGLISVLLSERKMRLGDMVAGTVVTAVEHRVVDASSPSQAKASNGGETRTSNLVAAFGIFLALGTAVGVLGASGDGSNLDEETAEIASVIETSATSRDPSVCVQLRTQRYLEQTEHEPGIAAVNECASGVSRPGAGARGVEVADAQVEGDRAIAMVTYEGGSLDGSTETIGLIRADDSWRLDRVIEIVDLDREAFVRHTTAMLAKEPWKYSRASVACVDRAIGRLSDEELESALRGGEIVKLTGTLVSCDREAFLDSILSSLRESDIASTAECVVESLRALSDRALASWAHDPVATNERAIDCDQDAVVAAYRRNLVVGSTETIDPECADRMLAALTDEQLANLAVDEGPLYGIVEACRV